MGALDGVRVLDLSRLLPGPACTAWLAGQGASVDRVEAPGKGDFARHIPPFVDGVGAYFVSTAADKRHLALDLRHPQAPELLHALLPHYDVLVEGFRPGVLEAIGLGPDVLRARFPRLVAARLSGFGQDGPWARRPGHDLNYVGLTGLVHGMVRNERGAPSVPPVQVADMAGALAAAAGIAAALVGVARTGVGRVVDVSLTEAALWCVGPALLASTADGVDPAPATQPLDGGLAIYGTWRCADGRFLTLGALEPGFQAALASEVGDLPDADVLAAAFASAPRDVWVDRLAEACAGPALAPSEVGSHPHLLARDAVRRAGAATFVRPVAGDWPHRAGPVPGIGADTDAVLADAGIPAARIAALRADGVVA